MKKSQPKPPTTLSAEARKWWIRLSSEYEIVDEAGLFLLQAALEAFDRMRQAQKILATDGIMVRDRFEQKKAHPLLTAERDARSQMLHALKELRLDAEPLNSTPGRPPGS